MSDELTLQEAATILLETGEMPDCPFTRTELIFEMQELGPPDPWMDEPFSTEEMEAFKDIGE
jgi:hypothetical protein